MVGVYREERLEVPVAALREALVNALAHRLYVRRGTSVSLAIYDDRVEIVNPGAFPRGLTAEELEKGNESEPRNPIIARVLYLRKMLESWGRGIRLMGEECTKAGLPKPRIESDGQFVKVVFARPQEGNRAPKWRRHVPNDGEFAASSLEQDVFATASETATETTPETATETLPKGLQRVLDAIKAKPTATLAELAKMTGLSKDGVKWNVRKLKVLNKIRRIGYTKGGRWESGDNGGWSAK